MKKMIKNYGLAVLAVLVYASCKEESFETAPMAAVNVVNAVVGGKNVKLNTNTVDSVVVNSAKVFSILSGDAKLSFYPSGSPSTPYYSNGLAIGVGELYSLYLTGQVSAVESVLVRESIRNYADSVMAVRVVNLSPGSTPLNVTLSGTPTVNEFSDVAYKTVSAFKKYPVGYKVLNTYFTFQVRNASTGALLASYGFTAANLTSSRMRNVTLVYRGITGGTGTSAPGITFVPNY